ncbi:MAG: hypothetical protein OXC93_11925 [Rhodospirillaceae bacterium]|nr:hypothetical protein [Rhodospirillaceae bacterium]
MVGGHLQPGDHLTLAVPRAGGVIELSAKPRTLSASVWARRIPHQAEDVIDAVLLAPRHRHGR